MGHLVRLIGARLTLDYVSNAWRKTRVVFILKAKKSRYDSPKDFRLITLAQND